MIDGVDNRTGDGIYSEPPKETGGPKYVQLWLEAIALASDEEKDWRGHAQDALAVYNSDDAKMPGTAFNLYHANIETIVPALYNSTPVPDIRRRYGDRDQAAKEGADAIERVLTYSIDEYNFDSVMEGAVHHYAMCGRGVVRVHYNVEVREDGSDTGAQTVTCRLVPWEAFRRGPAQCWDDVPWVAFRHHMTREQVEDLVGRAKAKDVALTVMTDGKADDGGDPEKSIFHRARIWEIWEKSNRQVIYICDDHKDDPLLVMDDPLGLRDFFPVPKPLYIDRKDDTCVPLCTYAIQRPLLEEIDIVSRRIRNLIKQLRPRALGPDTIDMSALADAGDGDIVGIADVMPFLESGGMDKMLSWFPMEPTVKAIQSLYEHRQLVKQDLFEVSGLADIMRGQSNYKETLGAQQMKAQWGSLRINRAQKNIQFFARDVMRMKAELIAEKFTPDNIGAMTGTQLAPQAVRVLKDDKLRSYRIDIETDSTIRSDLTRNMEAMTQFMGGTAQFMQALEPATQIGVPPDAIVTIFSAFARNFKLGKEVDAVLDGLPDQIKELQQQPQQPSPEEQKMQAEMQMMQAEMKAMQEKMAMELQAMRERMAMDAQARQQELAMKMQEGQMKLGLEREKMAIEQQKMQMNLRGEAVAHQQDLALSQEQAAMKQSEQRMSHQNTIEAAKAKAQAAKIKPKAGAN